MKFSVLVSELQAALLFASTDENRFVLNGVHVEMRKKGAPIIVSTDGRRLCVIESDAMQDDELKEDQKFTIGAAFLKPLLQFAKSQSATLVIEPHMPKRCVFHLLESHCVIDSEEGALTEGEYPNWRQVIPNGERTPINALGVSSEYMADFHKSAKLLGLDVPLLQFNFFNATAAMEVRIEGKPNFFGVLMPARTQVNESQPEFLFP